MEDTASATPAAAAPASRAAPISFWVIAALSLLWNAFGGYDYLMTRMRNMDYLSQMGDAQAILAWVDAFPVWAQIAWPLGVWASVAGSVLLLFRSRLAVAAFLVSLVSAAVSFAAQFAAPMPASLDTTANKIMPLVILAIIAFLWWFSRRSQARGILR